MKQAQENEINLSEVKDIPYVAHERDMARLSDVAKKLWIAVILLIVLLVGSNIGWIIYEAQFVDEVWTVEATTDSGGTAVANGSGDMNYYGNGESDRAEANP